MHTHLVVPLDGSSLAETVLPHTTALARVTSATVTLLRVIPPVTSLGLRGVELPENWFDEEMAWSRNYLGDIVRQLTDEGVTQVQTAVLEGDPATEIIAQYVEAVPKIAMGLEQHAGLVVMTARSRDDRQQHLLRTVSEKFLQHSEVPILLTQV